MTYTEKFKLDVEKLEEALPKMKKAIMKNETLDIVQTYCTMRITDRHAYVYHRVKERKIHIVSLGIAIAVLRYLKCIKGETNYKLCSLPVSQVNILNLGDVGEFSYIVECPYGAPDCTLYTNIQEEACIFDGNWYLPKEGKVISDGHPWLEVLDKEKYNTEIYPYLN